MVKIALVLQQSAFTSALAREAHDMLLALAAVEHQLTVIYLGEAVCQLLPTAVHANLGCKDFTPGQKLFGLYEIEQLLVSSDACLQYRLTADHFRVPVQLCSMAELQQQLSQQQHILRF
jgi:tRNA 2-thiouridine synthesizing protein C